MLLFQRKLSGTFNSQSGGRDLITDFARIEPAVGVIGLVDLQFLPFAVDGELDVFGELKLHVVFEPPHQSITFGQLHFQTSLLSTRY